MITELIANEIDIGYEIWQYRKELKKHWRVTLREARQLL